MLRKNNVFIKIRNIYFIVHVIMVLFVKSNGYLNFIVSKKKHFSAVFI